ncbi:uncharacterized protein LOC131618784 [Vicia villosa]|uniref:uncharacterized protein LOC131618784 n=1 Tax=Vicia villosa TaxID=3911 RepID=UPI00273AA69B|nr:uncharacterized protein LOC131618784 [Vicia villosa]
MAQNHYQWGSERTPMEKSQTKGGMYEIRSLDKFNAKIDALTQKIESLTMPPAATVAAITPNYELCGVFGHAAPEFQILAGVAVDQVNYAQSKPYSNTYNHGWKNHLNILYKNNNALYAPGQTPAIPPGYQKPAATVPNIPWKSNLEI